MVIFTRIGWFILLVKSIIDFLFIYRLYRLHETGGEFIDYQKALMVWVIIRLFIEIIYILRVKIYLKLLLKKLGAGFFEYRVKILCDNSINAFAYTNATIFRNSSITNSKKYIAITTGFLKKCSKDEVNFAIAHELSHHRNDDLIVKLGTTIFGKLLQFGLFFIKKLSWATFFGKIAFLSIEIGTKCILKRQELRADIDAFNYLRKANIDPIGGVKFFERISRKNDIEKNMIGKIFLFIYDEHPFTETRVNKQRELLKQFKGE